MWRVDGWPADQVPVDDRGLAYGDGLFETLPVVGGRPALWRAHRERLRSGCRRLGFAPPEPDALDREVDFLVAEGAGMVKFLVTRGSAAGRGYSPPPEVRPRVIAGGFPVPQRPAEWWRDGDPRGNSLHHPAIAPAGAGRPQASEPP
ncbi:MAG: aminotransferase class IV [Arhodomonas sp.]|nr:aminotransferase class IV [Arhodomonas sp.]